MADHFACCRQIGISGQVVEGLPTLLVSTEPARRPIKPLSFEVPQQPRAELGRTGPRTPHRIPNPHRALREVLAAKGEFGFRFVPHAVRPCQGLLRLAGTVGTAAEVYSSRTRERITSSSSGNASFAGLITAPSNFASTKRQASAARTTMPATSRVV